MSGAFDTLLDLFVNGLENLAGPQDDLSTGTTAHGDAEEFGESVGNFAMGHAGTLVEVNDGGLGV
jgi:hypothetical protein